MSEKQFESVSYRRSEEYEAFCKAIGKTPDDDLPRLAAADWLDEHGYAVRAELIRLDVELRRCPHCEGTGSEGPCNLTHHYRNCHPCKGNRRKVEQLTRRIDWGVKTKDHVLSERMSSLRCGNDYVNGKDCACFEYPVDVDVRRGFVEDVAGRLASLLPPCSGCDGSKTERFADAAGDMDDRVCSTCKGLGYTFEGLPAMGCEVYTIRNAVVTDKRPYHEGGVPPGIVEDWSWMRETLADPFGDLRHRDVLTDELWELLTDGELVGPSQPHYVRAYTKPDDADRDLWKAVVKAAINRYEKLKAKGLA